MQICYIQLAETQLTIDKEQRSSSAARRLN
jgi:hypothetical protein